MARHLKTDGTVEEVEPINEEYFRLTELQDYVDGFFEMYNLPSGDWLIINEDGCMKDLPLNVEATMLTGGCQQILGDALHCVSDELEENEGPEELIFSL